MTYGIDTQRLGLEAMKEERMEQDVKRDFDTYAVSLREQMAAVLDAADLAAWDEYAPYAEQYLYESMLEGQLTMLAPGLDAENRGTATAVIPEEMVAHIEAFEGSDMAYSTSNYFDAQEDALNVSVERLGEVFDAEQLAFIENFRDLAAAQFQALSPEEE